MRRNIPGKGEAILHLIDYVERLDGQWITAIDLQLQTRRSRDATHRAIRFFELSDRYEVIRGRG